MAHLFSKSFLTVLFSGFALAMVGCASSDQFTAMKLDRDRLSEQLISAQSEVRQAKGELAGSKAQLDGILSSNGATGGILKNLQEQNSTLGAQLEDYKKRYEEALANGAKGGVALNPTLTSALNTMASENPDLVEFDSARGVIKFKSDVTFGVGDATVTGKAKEVIDRFAKILTSGSASGYELLVQGHTDNAPVSSAAVKAAGHKNNWYLSAHRAISVSEELMRNGVSSARIGIVGFADQHPVASNATSSGQAQNRRVEVVILSSIAHSAPIEKATQASHKELPVKVKANPNKDTGPTVVPTPPPVINK